MEKNGKLCGNFWQYYADESDDYAKKMPDYAEISKKKTKLFPWLFSMYKIHLNVLPIILVLYYIRYFFVQRSFSIVFVVKFV